MNQYLIPCLGSLAQRSPSEPLFKALHRKILLKTRHHEPEVRMVALGIIEEVYQRKGADMLVYFPETIPFLAELLEDEDENVEVMTKQLCEIIQTHLGEPIEPYFNAK